MILIYNYINILKITLVESRGKLSPSFFRRRGVYDEVLYAHFNQTILFCMTSFVLFNICTLLNLFYKIKKSFCIIKRVYRVEFCFVKKLYVHFQDRLRRILYINL